MPESKTKLDPATLASGVQGAATIGGMYYDVLSSDYDQVLSDIDPGIDSRASVNDIASQEFQKEGFNFGKVASSTAAGASVGAALAPVTGGASAPIGAIGGLVAGIGSEVIRLAKQRKARQRFEQQQEDAIAGAIAKNRMIDYRRMSARNIGVSLKDQYNTFY